MHGSGLSLVVWQGWGVLSVMALLTALLAILLTWLLPFPERSLDRQLSRYEDRSALKNRLGAAPPFNTYLQTVHRFNEWLAEWFGTAFSVQAFERCVAIAFFFPIALFVATLAANGLTRDLISFPQLALFILVFAVFCYVIAVAFNNLLGLIRHAWMRFGGDSDLAQMISRVLLGAFAVMVAFTISFAIAATFSGQVSNASSVLGSMAGGFALAFAFAIAFALAGAVLFSVAIAILAGVALAFASDFTLLLFLILRAAARRERLGGLAFLGGDALSPEADGMRPARLEWRPQSRWRGPGHLCIRRCLDGAVGGAAAECAGASEHAVRRGEITALQLAGDGATSR